MKKVLIVRTNKVEPDPRVEKEANALKKTGWLEVEIFAWDRGGKYPCRKENLNLPAGQIPIYRIGIPGNWGKGMKNNVLPAIIYEFKCLVWLLKNVKKYDCVHACDLMTGLPALIPVKLNKKKLIYDCCDYYADSQQGPSVIIKLLRKMETFVIEHADATILCTEDRMEQITPAVPKMVAYIHNAPDMNTFEQKAEVQKVCLSNSKRLKLVYVGNFCTDRWLVELVNNITELDDIAELHIGGFGGLEDEILKVAEHSKNIYFYGKLQYGETLQLENECDVIVALYETHLRNHMFAAPNKVYEALALGKPLLMFRKSGMSNIVKENNIGTLIEPTKESFQKGILELRDLIDNSLDVISPKMKRLYDEKYNWTIMEERLNDLYHLVLDNDV